MATIESFLRGPTPERLDRLKKRIIAEHMVDNDVFDDEVLQGLMGGVTTNLNRN